ncbi:MAG: MATE family efflux transporter [Ruminococcaceae bacterium]|nr:MATE family efflux transporter [Oscillospiraceae bacterium]
MSIQLSEHFNYSKLIRFTVPSMIMMVFTSIYGVVDGIFVSNFVGKTAFAAVNLIMPFLMLFGAIGFMIGTGGSALVAKTMGEGDRKKANRLFSMLIYLSILFGVALTVLGILFLEPIARLLGAEGQMLEDCVVYGRIILIALTAFMLQNEFQSFLIAAEKPTMGLAVTVAAGVINMVLDALFVGILKWGLIGAALATAISQAVGGFVPLLYFALPNKSLFRLTGFFFDGRALLKACTNGSSEMMTNFSLSLVNMLYNFRLMEYAGEDGIAAYGVILYVGFVFLSIFIGYSIGVAPVVGFHFGAENHGELKSLFRKSLVLLAFCSTAMTVSSVLLAEPLARIFAGYDEGLLEMTVRGLCFYSFSFLAMGVNIFASAFFTALNDGLVSAALSFLRLFLFQVGSVLLLPLILDLDGIWLAVVMAEFLALGVSILCFVRFKKKYHYA